MSSGVQRRGTLLAWSGRSTCAVLFGVGVWIVLTGLAAPVDQIQRHIAALEEKLSRLERQEHALITRQDELSGVIKQLKTESRSGSGPFTTRKIESSLRELRAVLVDMDDLDRQETETVRDLNSAKALLRSAIQDEVARRLAVPSPAHPAARQMLGALLDAYPTAPDVPPIPPVHQWPAIPLSAEPDVIAERTTLLRNERERQDVALRQAELIHQLLDDERALSESVGEPEASAHIQRRGLNRRIEDAAAQITASRQAMRTLDETLQRLEARLPKTGQVR
ncbi:MAG: hypothetical protein HY207_13910 [Nitrospirae bacterium]|nr:hypothetical protein [Nitrospirota bacterium]